MKKIAVYLNSLSRAEQERFAARCGTSVGYLRKASSLGLMLREKLCALIELHSGGAVTRVELRPDDWATIWPELAKFNEKQAPAHNQKAQTATETVAPAPGAAHV